MRTDEFVLRLDKVKRFGADKYMACCPAHDDKSPSLSVTQHGDRILIKCFAGCTSLEVVESMGLSLVDLFDDDDHHHTPPHAFAQQEFRKKRRIDEKIQEGVTFLKILTMAMKKGEDIVTKSDIEKGRRIRQWLKKQGVIA